VLEKDWISIDPGSSGRVIKRKRNTGSPSGRLYVGLRIKGVRNRGFIYKK
jgi:hypothetical protein